MKIISTNLLYDDPSEVGAELAFQNVYRVEFDEIPVYPDDALDSPDIPIRYSQHKKYKYAFLMRYSCRRVDDIQHVVDVTCYYESSGYSDDKGKAQELDPLKRALTVDWSTWTVQEPVTHWRRAYASTGIPPAYKIDSDGSIVFTDPWVIDPKLSLLTNSAGTRILHQQERCYRAFHLTKIILKPDPIFAEGGTFVNNDKVTIEGHTFDKLTLKATNVRFSPRRYEEGKIVRTMSWDYYHRPESWITPIDNVGFEHLAIEWQPNPANANQIFPYLVRTPIKTGTPPEKTSEPQPLCNFDWDSQASNRHQYVVLNQAGLAQWPVQNYPNSPAVLPGVAGVLPGYETGGVTNGNFSHGHVHPACTRVTDEREPTTPSPNIDAAALQRIIEQNRLYGLTYQLISFKTYFPNK